jgi:hypothetical protein
MNTERRRGWPSLVWTAALALAGCGQANARNAKAEQSGPAVAAHGESDAQPSAEADRDNGPGCVESVFVGASPSQRKKVVATK